MIAFIGAGGFVGTRLIETCLLEGIRNICAIIRSPRILGRLCRFGTALDIRMADATNVNDLLNVIKDCPIVVNLTSSNNLVEIINTTKAIYTACVSSNVERLIHISSAVVYGQVESPTTNDDSPPLTNHWMPYARVKAKSETFLKDVSNSSQLEIIVLRPGIVWGPRSYWSYNAARDLINNTAYLVGNGEGVCNSIYIDNLVSSIITCCRNKKNASGFYNVSDAEFITWYDFYGSLAEYLGYNMSQMPKIPDNSYKPSLNSCLEYIKSQSIYIKIKNKIPEDMRTSIKYWIKERFDSTDNFKNEDKRRTKLHITREMWHLQTVRYKLPTEKFSKFFNHTPPISFREGIRMTINWLKFIGILT